MKTYIYFLVLFLLSISVNKSLAKTTIWCGCVGFDKDYLGDASDIYFHPNNWSNGFPGTGDLAIIPDAETDPIITEIFGPHDIDYDLLIGSGATLNLNDYVVIHSGYSVTIESGGFLYFNISGIMDVNGSLINNGVLTIGDGKYFIAGSTKLIIDNGTYTNNNFTFVHEDILINPNGHLVNNATFQVDADPWGDDSYTSDDRVTNKGLFINGQDGEIQITEGGVFYNEGYLLNSGTVLNDKDFWNKNSGVIDNEGLVTNKYAFKNTGTLNNTETFSNDAGTFENHLNTVNNTGEFILENQGIYISTSSAAIFENTASGIFTVEQSTWFLNNLGIFNNGGLFDNKGNFENASNFSNTGTLKNIGVIELTEHSPPNLWSRMYNFGTIENRQTITITDAELINYEYVDNVGASIRIFSTGEISNEECAVFNNGSTIDNYGTFTNAGFLAQWLGRGIGPNPVQHTASGSQLDRIMPNVSYAGVNKLFVKNVGLLSNQSGLTWSDAMGDLNFAMQMAKCHNISEIWLSKGTYYPDEGSSGFFFQGGLKLYGGFNGNESSKNNRDIMANKTILANNGSGSILTVFEAPGTSVIDGIHFMDGSASKGGAVYHSNDTNNSSITFNRCVFQNNTASSWGGAIYNRGKTTNRTTQTFLNNCLFVGNSGSWGGAINIDGAGINSTTGANSSKVNMRNCTFYNNTASDGGGDIRVFSGGIDAFNTIFWGNGTPLSDYNSDIEVEYCIVRGGWSGVGNMNQVPQFEDPAAGNYSLKANSPGVDDGNSESRFSTQIDLMGINRPQGNSSDIGAYEYQGALPVEFLDFSARLNGQSVLVEWVTGSEVNNDYFEVQRSLDGKKWEVIGTVEGAGTSNEILEYDYIDHYPAPGMNYFRLKQVDYDGQYDYSSIERVLIEPLYSIELFPNPTHDYINLQIPNETNINSKIFVYDAMGRKLSEINTDVSHQPTLQFNLERMNIFSPGKYHLVVQTGNHVEKLSFIKI